MKKNTNKVKRTPEEKKKLNWKIAEIVYYSIGGIILTAALVCGVLASFLNSMDGRFSSHPFYPLLKAQSEFFTWLGINQTFASSALILFIISLVYFLCVFAFFANRADDLEKRETQRKKRQKQLQEFKKQALEANTNSEK